MQVASETTLDAADEALTILISPTGASKPFSLLNFSIEDGAVTYVTAVIVVEVQLKSGGTWFNKASVNLANNATIPASNYALSDASENLIQVDRASGFYAVRIRLVSIVSGGLKVNCSMATVDEVPTQLPDIVLSTANAAQAISSTSANALAVGPAGTTNPTFNVNSNTASAVTGLTVVGAATGNGVALTATDSGSNTALAINAKGTGILSLNTTATGQVYHSIGAKKAAVFGSTLTALGTTQSSTPTAAELIGGILTQTGQTGAGAFTLPTGTAISAALPVTPAQGHTFQTLFTNLGGGQTITITGATGTTVVGEAAVASATSRMMTWQCTAANTWTIHCH